MILGILDGLPGNNTYVGRLLQNYQDMEDAHNGDTAAFNDAKACWYDNGRQIAVQMNKMNPRFWPLERVMNFRPTLLHLGDEPEILPQ